MKIIHFHFKPVHKSCQGNLRNRTTISTKDFVISLVQQNQLFVIEFNPSLLSIWFSLKKDKKSSSIEGQIEGLHTKTELLYIKEQLLFVYSYTKLG